MPGAGDGRLATTAGAKSFCEFFAGIGLVREGLQGSGWECVYANDIDAKKHAMYKARFGEAKEFHREDVWNTEEVVSRISDRPFLATASFPCVDLSLAGHRRGFEGADSSSYFGFAKVLESLGERRPPLVMLENVAGLVSGNEGKDFVAVAESLAGLGYWLDAFMLDAEHFVPQSRPRVFMIGMLHGFEPPGAIRQASKDGFMDPWRMAIDTSSTARTFRTSQMIRLMQQVDLSTGWILCNVPQPPPRRVQLEDVIDLDDGQEWWAEDEVQRHYRMMSDLHRGQVDKLIAGKGRHVGTIYRRVRKGSQKAEVRFDGVAGCLRTPRGGSAKQIVIVVDAGRLRMRWMSPREYARLQGAGGFPLTVDRIQLLFGFGDAVCVPVISWIDRHVLTPAFNAAQQHAERYGYGGQPHPS